ncbi:IclR family transcriptional regulator [Frigidibacter sp. MR17.14]|uniref:IclR family transcriptional regulator n=1 Tax=Frigidibacter sp. MR17.14 TaxID=3126509 RepID=UPI003012A713
MSSVLEKALNLVEILADHPSGLQVSILAARTGQPVSGVHRTLQELARLGYVRQIATQGDYALTIKLPAMGLAFLGRAGVPDISQPILDRLAQRSGELIRLSVIEGDQLTWVGVAQGATGGLRYDPGLEQGVKVHLASSAGGQAWLSTMADEDALARVYAQGLVRDEPDRGRGAPVQVADLLARLAAARVAGYAVAANSYYEGMTAMAAPVRYRGTGPVIGCVSIAGPSVRMTPERVRADAPALLEAAADLGEAAAGSQFFQTLLRALEGDEPGRRIA